MCSLLVCYVIVNSDGVDSYNWVFRENRVNMLSVVSRGVFGKRVVVSNELSNISCNLSFSLSDSITSGVLSCLKSIDIRVDASGISGISSMPCLVISWVVHLL